MSKGNKLYYGDNLEILRNNKHVPDDSVDLVYIDPPFNSQRDYNVIYDGATAQAKAFSDTWSIIGIPELEERIYTGEPQRYQKLHAPLDALKKFLYHAGAQERSLYAYLVNMGIRLVELHWKLKETGSLYLHCDPTASHYLKILLDAVFGRRCFRNEIIWHYKRWPTTANRFQRMHDVILFYGKSDDQFFRVHYQAPSASSQKRWKGRKQLVEFDETGKRLPTQELGDASIGVPLDDVWDISIIAPSAKERLGYPTQKPEALLERIIRASCPEGGTVLDAYCGCGTTIAVAQRLGMKWIGVDITYLAIDLIQQRLVDHFYLHGITNVTPSQKEAARKRFLQDTEVFGIPKDMESARKLARETKGDYVRKEFEKWAVFSVGGVYSEKKGADGGVDGYFYIYDTDAKGKAIKKQCYIQVKSGKVGVKDIRDFDSTLTSLSSPVGIFISLEQPTSPMSEYAQGLPKYRSALGRVYSKVNIITIQQILDEEVPDFAVRATKKAEDYSSAGAANGDLFLDSEE